MDWLRWIGIAIAAVAVLVLGAGQLGLFRGKTPENLGVRDGRLKRPSMNPNSVSSQAHLHADNPMREVAQIAPLPATGDTQASMARLRQAIDSMAGATVVEQQPDYLYVQFESRVMRFVDDAEFWFDPAIGAIQVRSASRLGRKDLGVNRARIESIRARMGNS